MRISTRPALRLALGATLAVAALAGTAQGAAAAPTYYEIKSGNSYADPRCLVGHGVDVVVTTALCTPSNPLQHWERWQGGWTKHRSSGLCLATINGSVFLETCNANAPWQFWQSWNGGWYQNTASGQCLQAYNYNSVSALPCGDPFNPPRSSIWWTRVVSPI